MPRTRVRKRSARFGSLSESDKQRARDWFESLRDRICAAFETLEDIYEGQDATGMAPGRFERRTWQRDGGGGGVMSVMRGRVFEKVGVNVSTVHGEFSEKFRNQIPGTADGAQFWASGISLVAHLRNPHAPPAHMNTRHIRTGKTWFGGGADLNPIYPDDADTTAFHARLKQACDSYSADAYERFKAWADEYFFLPHRGEHRGVGGIFYDYLEGEHDRHFAFTKEVGEAFLDIYPKLVARRMNEPWSDEQRAYQCERRGRYAEFNLIYDRGTRFGLETGGNTEAILMSLPPVATWR
ncbi:MAG: oxygen-dependent coproporphyrinogen oxidase [Geminicoccaceae bacterium]|nr:oxygen-dependent coproporphyrinogen oxidase [Geminicoccaceae bacterium]